MADAIFLAKLIQRHRPDCLIANFAAVNWMCVVGWLCRVRYRIAFYHTINSQIERDHRDSSENRRKLRRLRKSVVYRTATDIAGISHAALQDAQTTYRVPARKCRIWRYSMPDPAGSFKLRSNEERDHTIVCAGRLHPSKGQDVLIRAVAQAQNVMGDIRVEFLGNGPSSETLRGVARDHGVSNYCTFVGSVPHEEVLARMSRAKLTVVPSRSEAFGLVNIESMAVGTPVIASNVDGVPEIVHDGKNGWLVPPEDPEALAEMLTVALQNDDLRNRLGQNARQSFLERFEESLALTQQAEALEGLIQTAGRPVSDES